VEINKITDKRIISQGRTVQPAFDSASSAPQSCMAGVLKRLFKASLPMTAPLTKVRDVNGKFYPFELDENTLYELDHRDEAVIPEQYRISERIAS
jgi:hypothetical protein